MLEKIVIWKKTKINKSAKPTRYYIITVETGLSQKLRKSFKKVGCNISFKSLRNLNAIMTIIKRNHNYLPTVNQEYTSYQQDVKMDTRVK